METYQQSRDLISKTKLLWHFVALFLAIYNYLLNRHVFSSSASLQLFFLLHFIKKNNDYGGLVKYFKKCMGLCIM